MDAVTMGHINQEQLVRLEEILQVWECSGHRRIALAFSEQ